MQIASLRIQMLIENTTHHVWVHICGGLLISPNLVISAGSCINAIKRDGGEFIYSQVVFQSNCNLKPHKIFTIERVRHYDDYNCLYHDTTYTIDVGLIIVGLSINFHSTIQ